MNSVRWKINSLSVGRQDSVQGRQDVHWGGLSHRVQRQDSWGRDVLYIHGWRTSTAISIVRLPSCPRTPNPDSSCVPDSFDTACQAHQAGRFAEAEEGYHRIQTTKRPLCLVEAGWFSKSAIEAEFKARARSLCPNVKTIHVDGNHQEYRHRIWRAADLFVSLADNIQETFGLSPIEAMAASLPVVVSDWDGYKDTVRHGIDGFRVPTIMASAGAGTDLALRYARGKSSTRGDWSER